MIIFNVYRLGPVVGNFCMDLAIEKAKAAGVGIVSVRGNYQCYNFEKCCTDKMCKVETVY
jgi:LDH2 family malate/lactate/ureidoglycolate dehydrogenase